MIPQDKCKKEPLLPELEELCRQSALHAWAHGKRQCRQFPTFAYVNLTNRCNYRCVMCGYKEMMRPERGFMEMDTLERVMAQLPKSVYRIWLMKQGESLHPRFGEMVAYMKKVRPEISLQLATNASVMNRERCRALVEHLDYLDIGIHGISGQTLKKITKVGNLQKVMDNIIRLDRMIGESSSKLTYNLTYVRQHNNRHESDQEVIDYFGGRLENYNNIVIKWESNFQGNISEANLPSTREVPPDKFPKCTLPYVVMTVLHDGKISYCPAEAEEKVLMGDIREHGLEEIWNNQAMGDFRDCLARGDFPALEEKGIKCRDCTWPWSLETTNLGLFVDPESKKLLRDPESPPPVALRDFLHEGFVKYLNAEVGGAWEMFQTAAAMESKDESGRALARKWVGEVELVLQRRYGNLELWEESLKPQGRSLTELRRKIAPNPRKAAV